MWGLTASDGPANTTLLLNGSMRQFHTYWARGISLFESNDDGTLAPTAAGGAVAFTPEIAIPALLARSEEHTSELQSQSNLVCRLLLEKKKTANYCATVAISPR